ncbi:LysM peptidoglycan-binding domain-containing protein [Camelliibacillus cellulosilyticus]|uniref:LysM peptidoglycan-binding domain-containing protein n=1 Tax=Camelliibacillus cellulosilyticus TaxID=2174486 RepID=A0ABV9GML9_9BACL
MKIYTVQKGDTLSAIAQKHGITLAEIKKMNPQLTNPDKIMPGMKVKVPTGSKHVKKKEMIMKKEKPVKEMAVKEKPMKEKPVKEKVKEKPIEEKAKPIEAVIEKKEKEIKTKKEPIFKAVEKKEFKAKEKSEEVKAKAGAPMFPMMEDGWTDQTESAETNEKIPMMEDTFPNMINPKSEPAQAPTWQFPYEAGTMPGLPVYQNIPGQAVSPTYYEPTVPGKYPSANYYQEDCGCEGGKDGMDPVPYMPPVYPSYGYPTGGYQPMEYSSGGYPMPEYPAATGYPSGGYQMPEYPVSAGYPGGEYPEYTSQAGYPSEAYQMPEVSGPIGYPGGYQSPEYPSGGGYPMSEYGGIYPQTGYLPPTGYQPMSPSSGYAPMEYSGMPGAGYTPMAYQPQTYGYPQYTGARESSKWDTYSNDTPPAQPDFPKTDNDSNET